MIELTKLNKEKFFMNCELIEIIELMPDTLITMTNGRKYYCLESAEEVIKKITEYKKELFTNCSILNNKSRSMNTVEEVTDEMENS